MANHLDLEEQEQLEQLKHFWNQYGNLISWLLMAVLVTLATWNVYQYWQKNLSSQAAALFEEIERSARSSDLEKANKAFDEMKERFSSTVYAQQSGLLVANLAFTQGNLESTRMALSWVAENKVDNAYAVIARLRLSTIFFEKKDFAEALRVLDVSIPDEFVALVDDRRGDIYAAQGKISESRVAYQSAYKRFNERSEYRKVVEVKLNALRSSVSSTETVFNKEAGSK